MYEYIPAVDCSTVNCNGGSDWHRSALRVSRARRSARVYPFLRRGPAVNKCYTCTNKLCNFMTDISDFIIDTGDGDTRIHTAAYEGSVDQIRELLKCCPTEINRRVRPFGATPLRLAVTREWLESAMIVC